MPVVYPASLPDGWTPTSVDLEPGDRPAFSVGMLTDDGKFVGLRQQDADLSSLLAAHVNGEAVKGDTVSVSGSVAPEWQEWSAAGCRSAGIGCLDCKAALADHLLQRLSGIHARRPELEKRPDTVWDILLDGSRKAREVAETTMADVRAAMKISYRKP